VVDDAKIPPIGSKERLFKLKLFEYGGVIEFDEMKFRANN
jgi:hypothetical protein